SLHRHTSSLPHLLPNPTACRYHDAAWAWCERERSNLVAAVALGADTGFDAECWQIAAMARTYYHRACQWSDWAVTHEIALGAARDRKSPRLHSSHCPISYAACS